MTHPNDMTEQELAEAVCKEVLPPGHALAKAALLAVRGERTTS